MLKNNNYANFDLSNLKYMSPKKLENDIFLACIDNNEVVFETPVMTIFGDPEYNKIENCYELNLQFSVNDEKFYNFMRSIDDYNTEYIYKYSGNWFETKFPKKVINEFYESSIYNWLNPDKNIEIPFLKLSIPCDNNNNPLVDIINNNKYDTSACLKENIKVFCEIELAGLKFLKQRLITDWNVKSIQIFNENKINLTNHLINCKYNNKVIDEEMLDELAVESKLASSCDISSHELTISQSYDNSSLSYNKKGEISVVPEEQIKKMNTLNVQSNNSNLSYNIPKNNCLKEQIINDEKIDKYNQDSNSFNKSHNKEDDILSQIRIKHNELEKVLSEATEANNIAKKLNEEAKLRAEEIETISRSINNTKH